MLFKIALTLLVAWLIDVLGVYRAGQLVHVLLLVGLGDANGPLTNWRRAYSSRHETHRPAICLHRTMTGIRARVRVELEGFGRGCERLGKLSLVKLHGIVAGRTVTAASVTRLMNAARSSRTVDVR
jgi:hypothetical protein